MTTKTQRRNARRASARRERKGLNLGATARERIQEPGYIPTLDEIKALFGPAKTLGTPKGAAIAVDHAMNNSGGYSLLQHAFEMGQGLGGGPAFMGYAALSNIAQNGLIRACVETVADDMTREWIEIISADIDGDGDDSDDKKIIEDAMIDYQVREVFHKAAELNGYFGGCLIFIDTGAKDTLLSLPLDISDKSAELKNFQRFTVIEPINIFPGRYDSTNPLSPRYFNPDTWWVLSKEVHASRLIRIVGDELPVLLKPSYNFLGIPRAQILYDYVLHFQDARAAATRLLEKFSLTILKTDMQDILTNPNSTSSLDTRLDYMNSYRSNDGTLAIDMEMEDIVNVVTPLSGVTDIVRQQLEFVVAINRTPAVKTMGISPAGFNTGEADLTNYNDHVATEQGKLFRPGLQKALDIIQIVKFGKIDKSVSFEFRSLNEDDDAAIANTQKTKSDSDASYLDRNVLSPQEVRQKLAADPNSGYSGIDADQLPINPEDEALYADIENRAGDEGERGARTTVPEETN
ncbi:DUF1073 domain-containing protein [Rouxiella badensis]|uniref:phage portal protein n=1 Tax=Rouxiella badensis TaxID=1646377 RepID=UPI0022AB17AE|nr:DUF1073 domain-containing protein [Rouxiella badensis]WAT10140.1 DUF1073 domain-containing protein [Rouxiella badensis]